MAAILFLLIIGFGIAYFSEIGKSIHQGSFIVVDGDSLVQNGQRFRLLGIDAPESRQFCSKDGKRWDCGRKSTQYLKSLFRNGGIECQGYGLDKYERILVRCLNGKIDINRQMVLNGWAVSYGDYQKAEGLAKRKRLGIWAGRFKWPQDWRQDHAGLVEYESLGAIGSNVLDRIRLWLNRMFE